MSEAHTYRDFSGSTGDDWYFNDRKESALQQRIAELETKCDRLAAENAELRKDRERLEWCASHYGRVDYRGEPAEWLCLWHADAATVVDFERSTGWYSTWREAVDEAMGASGDIQRITDSAADGGGDE